MKTTSRGTTAGPWGPGHSVADRSQSCGSGYRARPADSPLFQADLCEPRPHHHATRGRCARHEDVRHPPLAGMSTSGRSSTTASPRWFRVEHFLQANRWHRPEPPDEPGSTGLGRTARCAAATPGGARRACARRTALRARPPRQVPLRFARLVDQPGSLGDETQRRDGPPTRPEPSASAPDAPTSPVVARRRRRDRDRRRRVLRYHGRDRSQRAVWLHRYPYGDVARSGRRGQRRGGALRTPDDCWRTTPSTDDADRDPDGPLRDIADVDSSAAAWSCAAT